MTSKKAKGLTFFILSFVILIMACGCSFVAFTIHPFSQKEKTLNEKEIAFLSEYYIEDKDNIKAKYLTLEEVETLKSLRALQLYLDSNYTDISYRPTEILPNSESGLGYDLYYVEINATREYVFHVATSSGQDYQVTYDEFSYS